MTYFFETRPPSKAMYVCTQGDELDMVEVGPRVAAWQDLDDFARREGWLPFELSPWL